MKTKLSEENIKNLTQYEQKLQQLTKIQTKMYEGIKRSQQNTLKQMQEVQNKKRRCLKQRDIDIKAGTYEEIVKHPANDGGTNGSVWMYLANFIRDSHDLSSVEKRMLERQRVREEIQRVKEEERLREEQKLRKQKQQEEYLQRIRSGKGFEDKKRKQKVGFNLQRQLHRREVQENRRRLERQEEYKRQQYYHQQN